MIKDSDFEKRLVFAGIAFGVMLIEAYGMEEAVKGLRTY